MKLKVASGHNKRPIKSFQKAGLKGDVTLTILKCLAFWTWTPGPYAKPRQGQGIKLEPSHVLQCVDRACQGHGVEICSTSPVSSLFNWWRRESHLNILKYSLGGSKQFEFAGQIVHDSNQEGLPSSAHM